MEFATEFHWNSNFPLVVFFHGKEKTFELIFTHYPYEHYPYLSRKVNTSLDLLKVWTYKSYFFLFMTLEQSADAHENQYRRAFVMWFPIVPSFPATQRYFCSHTSTRLCAPVIFERPRVSLACDCRHKLTATGVFTWLTTTTISAAGSKRLTVFSQ